MSTAEQKKALVKELEVYMHRINVQELYEEPGNSASKEWLGEVAGIFKNIGRRDYESFSNHRQHLYPSIPIEARKHAAEQIDGFIREKVAEYKRYNFDAEQSTIYVKQEIVEGFIKKQNDFNYKKLIKLLGELNSNYAAGYPYSCAMLLRAILDHIPPLLGYSSFEEVVSNYNWSRTDKEYMKKLLDFKNEADDALHRQISKQQDLLDMDSLPQGMRINRLLQECLVSNVSQSVLKLKPQKVQQNVSKIIVKLLKDTVSWANYSVSHYVWSSFRVDIQIDNFNNISPDYIYVQLKAKKANGEEWNAKNFFFESSSKNTSYKFNEPYFIEPKTMKDTGVFISDDEISTVNNARQIPDIDRDTMELIIKTRSGFEQVVPIKAGNIING